MPFQEPVNPPADWEMMNGGAASVMARTTSSRTGSGAAPVVVSTASTCTARTPTSVATGHIHLEGTNQITHHCMECIPDLLFLLRRMATTRNAPRARRPPTTPWWTPTASLVVDASHDVDVEDEALDSAHGKNPAKNKSPI